MFAENTDWDYGDDHESQRTQELHAALFENGSWKETSKLSKLPRASVSGEEIEDHMVTKQKVKACSKLELKSKAPKPLKAMKSKFQNKLEKKMMGARFRWINEQLYTTTGDQAKRMFKKEPELFDVYHHGFSTQVSKWPVNPLERIVNFFQDVPVNKIVADFGCGEGKLALTIPHKVFSFDLVACDTHIIACDMANVPLEAATVTICVFCLSLMGTNVSDFIKESRRVLVKNGTLKICEIVSRIASLVDFIEGVESHGFKLLSQDIFSTMFVDLEFSAISRKAIKQKDIILKPCNYKRR